MNFAMQISVMSSNITHTQSVRTWLWWEKWC